MNTDTRPNVKITRHSMADSVFRHAYGGTGAVRAEPAVDFPSTPGQTGGLRPTKPLPSPARRR